eukprot:1157280-Pelagomonas_calceolata.AAC.10
MIEAICFQSRESMCCFSTFKSQNETCNKLTVQVKHTKGMQLHPAGARGNAEGCRCGPYLTAACGWRGYKMQFDDAAARWWRTLFETGKERHCLPSPPHCAAGRCAADPGSQAGLGGDDR